MLRIMFVCHGNICRSPMAEFVLKEMVRESGIADEFFIASSATSTEEVGNPVHRGTRNLLQKLGISTAGKHAVQMRASDYDKYDLFIGMDSWNLQNMRRIFRDDPEGKIQLLLDYTDESGDIADPWYSGDFKTTYEDVKKGCEALLEELGY